jgi:hypothetical protein
VTELFSRHRCGRTHHFFDEKSPIRDFPERRGGKIRFKAGKTSAIRRRLQKIARN